MYQLIIKNGKVIDGSGQTMFAADIGVREGRISEIGQLHNEPAETIIDAAGKYVAPGFIDPGNHSDGYWRLFSDPELESLVYQGITTIVGGNCGSSLAPLIAPEGLNSIQKWIDIRGINVDWSTMREFLRAVEHVRPAVNFATLTGHSTIRRALLRDSDRELRLPEMKAFEKVIQRSIREGSFGLSTGLSYAHARHSSAEELSVLTQAAAKAGGIYSTHLRDEGEQFVRSVGEALDTARAAKVPVHISHFKVSGQEYWPLQKEALALVEQGQREGIRVSFDVFPYTATGPVLYTLLPDWVYDGGKKLMIGRIRDVAMRPEILKDLREKKYDYSKISISVSPLSRDLNRRNIWEIAQFQGKAPEEVLLDLVAASDGKGTAITQTLSEENVAEALKHPLSVVSSDGAGYNLEHRKSGDLVHPRNFGSFPRFLGRYVREKKLIGWEEAIRKMTGRTAEIFNLKDRGLIKKDHWADIVIFDPEKIADRATFENPYQYAQGIEGLVIGGEIVLRNGKYSGKRAGRILRSSD